jgi:hypothetical protein
MQPATNRYEWRDACAATALLAATVLYLSLFPHNLNPSDESVHLYDAKRLLGGAVMYRDVFNDITPGWMYLMAGLFRLFGTTIVVARSATAVIHGLAAVAIYLTCRGLGIRRGLSWQAPLLYVVLSQPAWPIASQHWLSTLLDVVVLWLCVLHLRDRGRWSIALGTALGLFVMVQQPRAAITAGGVGLWLILDYALDRRYGSALTLRSLIGVLGRVALGGAAVVVPLLGWLIARAGFPRVWRALVIFPIFDYGGVTHCPWGDVNIVTYSQSTFTFPLLLKYLPLALIPALARLTWAVVRGSSRDEARQLLMLIAFAGTSIASILYFPDFIHIAFIAPVFLVAIAESAEWAVRRLPMRAPLLRAVGALAAAALLVACVLRLDHNLVRLREANRFSRSSAFGRVDFNREEDALLYDRVKELMQGTSSRYLYCYPIIAHLYLMLDVENPTAHGFFVPGYSGPDLVQEVIDSLNTTRPPYIVFFSAFGRADDPVASWIRAHYEPIGKEGSVGWAIYRQKAELGAG